MNAVFSEHTMSSKVHLAEAEQVDEELSVPLDTEGNVTEQRSLNSIGVDILRLIFEQVFPFRN
jgi:hypothetical protein